MRYPTNHCQLQSLKLAVRTWHEAGPLCFLPHDLKGQGPCSFHPLPLKGTVPSYPTTESIFGFHVILKGVSGQSAFVYLKKIRCSNSV